ncbi:tRNA(Ile)-lysidine synthetase [Paucilactobacillus hokkaidonensis JCM 18461]|uniref:tRNA(Ile)-lysidine synthase n=1 Tax=Paucilactobacillus hokkaidonensis JCM 18461 TaxID=1291742 RepID=A0A0A1GX03_9LACO|nr:tRNA lysidine(34) synthetase TilS [Paucilactobacillus hokkaidonensis]BAP84981.1 tRNA(Ile)-lysidine synthetase [Paucilactobacillus hokkaidonensis JCM 18461]
MKTAVQAKFERNLAQYRFFNTQETVVLAVSTGIDSMVLLELFLRLPPKRRPKILVAHVNHELRDQSVQEEQFIRSFCDQHHLDLEVTHWAKAKHPASGIEEAARSFRYHFFATLLQQKHARILVTAHQANDQAETMLMKLVRGGQVAQLAGIANQRKFKDGYLIRPLLNVSRTEIAQFAHENKIKWFEDETNTDLSIQRNRFRQGIIPNLQTENPAVVDHLIDYQRQLVELIDFADNQLRGIVKQVNNVKRQLNLDLYQQLEQTTKRLVLSYWLEKVQLVTNLSQAQLGEMEQLLDNRNKPQTRLKLNDQLELIKQYQYAWVVKIGPADISTAIIPATVLKLNHWYSSSVHESIGIFAPNGELDKQKDCQVNIMWLPSKAFPLQLRRWQAGDVIALKNGHHQQVRRVLIDQKLNNAQRQDQLVITDQQGNVIWLVGRKFAWWERPLDYQDKWQQVAFVRRFIRGE